MCTFGSFLGGARHLQVVMYRRDLLKLCSLLAPTSISLHVASTVFSLEKSLDLAPLSVSYITILVL